MTTERVLGSGFATELGAGAFTIALAILGLAGVASVTLLAIACIVAGGGLLLGGSATGMRIRALRGRERTEMVGGLSAGLIGGATAVVLGILALIGIASTPLLSISAIALGAAMVSWSIVPAREWLFGISNQSVLRAGETARATQGLVGVGAIVLGLLALVGVASTALALIALLGIGAGLTLSGSALLAGTVLARSHA